MSDAFKFIIIILVFMLFNLVPLIATGLDTAKRDYIVSKENEECKPQFIPFAYVLSDGNETSAEYLNYCIEKHQADFIEIFIEPFRIMIDFFAKIGFNFINITDSLTGALDDITGGIFNIEDTFTNLLSGAIESVTAITDGIYNKLDSVNGIINGITGGIEDVITDAIQPETLGTIIEKANVTFEPSGG